MATHAPITGARSCAPVPDVSIPTIRRACQAYGISDSAFGRRAVGDPRLVHDMHIGRELRPQTRVKIAAFIASLAEARS